MFEAIIQHLNLAVRILINPLTDYRTFWLVLPLLLVLILVSLYFGRHQAERLGWNSAFSNSIVLFWVWIILLRSLLDTYSWTVLAPGSRAQTAMILLLCLLFIVLLLVFSNYFHALPKKMAFAISSSGSIYILAYLAISLIIGGIDLNAKTAVSSVILFIFLVALIEIIKHLVPMSKSSQKVIEKRQEKETRKKAGQKAARTRKLNRKSGGFIEKRLKLWLDDLRNLFKNN